jgi:hypothetical protein
VAGYGIIRYIRSIGGIRDNRNVKERVRTRSRRLLWELHRQCRSILIDGQLLNIDPPQELFHVVGLRSRRYSRIPTPADAPCFAVAVLSARRRKTGQKSEPGEDPLLKRDEQEGVQANASPERLATGVQGCALVVGKGLAPVLAHKRSVVVGAGPVGLNPALSLADADRSVLVLEKGPTTSDHSRAPII